MAINLFYGILVGKESIIDDQTALSGYLADI